MEDFDFEALQRVVDKKYPGYKLLELKLPGLKPKFERNKFSYYPIVPENDYLHIWVANKNDAIQIEITRDEYTSEIANI